MSGVMSDTLNDTLREPTTLEGTLERVVYTNEENAWSVVRIEVPGQRQPVTAVGNLLGVSPGEHLRLSGEWEQNPKFGRQFRVTSYLMVQPSTLVGIEKYLGSGLVPGIGPVMARRLVEKFGLDTLEVIENHPERLAQVPGIGPKRRAEIRRAWAQQRHVKDLMIFLQSHGVSTNFAVRIFKTYGDGAMGLVRQDPYRLARDIHGIGFTSADRIAASMGVPPDAPPRARAAVVHLLDRAAEKGHLFLPREKLVQEGTALLGIDAERLEEAVAALAESGEVHLEPRSGEAQPEPESGGEAVYPGVLWAAESGVAGALAALAGSSDTAPEIDVPRALEWFEKRESLRLAAEQRRAIELGLTEKVLVITGGPGTGKTTLVKGIVKILTKKGQRVELAAPTGRAAKRLSEATGGEARTIHRLLEFNPQTRAFERDQDLPLEADLVILDEVSMLDIVLAHHVLKAIPEDGRLVLVGDVDQLPSVGPGRFLADLIASGTVPVVQLTEIFRQARRSLIVINAHRVNHGQMPILDARREPGDGGPGGSQGDFFFIDRRVPEQVLSTVVYLVTERIPSSFGFDPVEDVQVLTPMNRGLLGTEQLNEALRERLNPARGSVREVARGQRSFRVGDKVMQIRNNYDLGVFNGDLGRITGIDEDEEKVYVRFDDRTVAHEFTTLDELVPAYACTIHKSQGSEYPCVVLPLHSQHWMMLERNLIYTALTRARQLAVMVGETRALGVAVNNRRTRQRYSLLAERLRREAAKPASKRTRPGRKG
jgi:exodeoxyribonuclease V alpha subunit